MDAGIAQLRRQYPVAADDQYPALDDGFHLFGIDPGQRRSVDGCRLNSRWCIRSARASDSIASDNIQLTGFFGGICSPASSQFAEPFSAPDPTPKMAGVHPALERGSTSAAVGAHDVEEKFHA